MVKLYPLNAHCCGIQQVIDPPDSTFDGVAQARNSMAAIIWSALPVEETHHTFDQTKIMDGYQRRT